MKWNFLLASTLVASSVSLASDFDSICRGNDESIIATDKNTNKMVGVYLCSKLVKDRPISIIKDENGDGIFDKNDTVAYFISKDFTYFRSYLEHKIENFSDLINEEFKRTNKNWTYYQLDVEDVLEISGVNDIQEKLSDLINKETLDSHDEDYAEEVVIEELYRQRYYDTQTSRFISPDPVGISGGDTNPYRYVKNRPTIHSDSFGLRTNQENKLQWEVDQQTNYLRELQRKLDESRNKRDKYGEICNRLSSFITLPSFLDFDSQIEQLKRKIELANDALVVAKKNLDDETIRIDKICLGTQRNKFSDLATDCEALQN